ncbi:hypothetical protein ASPACDRAFT_82387 [Aspergillus aculeatus ATCC 16872]|uniref:Uncharacterized protein n=1 Tax=Aspergillus aculeatus (strain ATCC 16872 / CBS 172.66 / WB 5094) TaxID=690307 RepID=A0A1L9WFN4_ASPA1|nr:uncharacterized protein ASPACDRAFT_82387 [Aspergillus aculeatus ATCC 16872]OJJ94980.1 hypothetical protein ASPACDRAFT_82387 [Aspergillus aculeatus ATCC 16872]
MDGRATNEGYINTRMKDDGTSEHHHVAVYDLIMEDARKCSRECPELFQQALVMYTQTDSRDSRKDILDGLVEYWGWLGGWRFALRFSGSYIRNYTARLRSSLRVGMSWNSDFHSG